MTNYINLTSHHQNSDPNTSDKVANEAVEATDNHDAINNKTMCVVNRLKNTDSSSNNLFQLYSKFKRKILKFNMMSPLLLHLLKIARTMPFRKVAINT